MCWLVPADLIDDELLERAKQVQVAHLDLPSEIVRYGADTRGGVGVSTPVC